jgi:hypothetical protein
MGKKNAYKDLERKSEGKTPLRKPNCRWDDNVNIYLKKPYWKAAQDRVQWGGGLYTVINLRVPWHAENS